MQRDTMKSKRRTKSQDCHPRSAELSLGKNRCAGIVATLSHLPREQLTASALQRRVKDGNYPMTLVTSITNFVHSAASGGVNILIIITGAIRA
jgi:hypothetical protein